MININIGATKKESFEWLIKRLIKPIINVIRPTK